jgi:cell division protein FtsZ
VMSEMGMAMMGTGTARGDDRAVAAAEAAINNPLLEDVNLAGACGILVNVTAGPNLTMREFDEIGQVVHQFASEDATVVVGTALDMEMQDDVRVTVVATGLNRGAIRQSARREEPVITARPRIVARTGTDDMPADYIQQPSRQNPAARAVAEAPKAKPAQAEPQIDYLDIPAFLRRQAD